MSTSNKFCEKKHKMENENKENLKKGGMGVSRLQF